MAPAQIAIKRIIAIILIVSSAERFCLIRTRVPAPDPAIKAAIVEPNVINFFRYHIVTYTDIWQDGRIPTSVDIRVSNKGIFGKDFIIFS